MTKHIRREANSLIKRFDTRNPFEIAEGLGIIVMPKKLGGMNGCYKYFKRNRYILINIDLPKQLQRIVCAHELGHDRFHRKLAMHKLFTGHHACRHDH